VHDDVDAQRHVTRHVTRLVTRHVTRHARHTYSSRVNIVSKDTCKDHFQNFTCAFSGSENSFSNKYVTEVM